MITYTDLLHRVHALLNTNLNEEYMKRVATLLKEYQNLVKDGITYSKIYNATETSFELSFSEVQINIREVCKMIPCILRDYLNGRIVKSISTIQNFVQDNKFQTIEINPEFTYYRARESKTLMLCTREDLFHVPYTHRGNVTTKRYSISGHPCLYLCRSSYMCWEELRRPLVENMYISAFKSKKKIKLLDLRMYKQFYNKAMFKRYIELLPIILICSMPTNNDSDTYKPEYILPQLFLHTATFTNSSNSTSSAEKDVYRGIIYSSTHIDLRTCFFSEPTDYCLTDCIVIPARNSIEPKFCSYLKNRFELTIPKNFGTEILCNRELMQTINNNERNEKHVRYKKSCFYLIDDLLRQEDFKSLT